MRIARWILLLAGLSFLPAISSAQSCSAPNAGFTIINFNGLYTAVWYPTAAPAAAFNYGTISGSVAYNAPVSTCAQYPLLLFSHGYAGCATQSVFLTEQLAREGYIVAAPNYGDAQCSVPNTPPPYPPVTIPDSVFQDPASWNNQSALYRYQQTEIALNGMLARADFGPQIDASRIAGFGHSLGGYTVFAMLGGWSNWVDTRMKAGLLLSPYMGPFVLSSPSTVPNVHLPVMYQTGTLDYRELPYIAAPGTSYDQSNTPKFLVELQNAVHLDFSNVVCGTAATVAQCLATEPNASLIDNYSQAFFEHYLNQQPAQLLFAAPAGLALYEGATQTTVSDASFNPSVPAAPNELVALFGMGMSVSPGQTASPGGSLPTNINGITVSVTDSAGVTRQASLYYVSATQINFVIPDGTATGTAKVSVSNAGTTVASGPLAIAAYSPSLFPATGIPGGVAKGWAELVNASGPPSYANIFDPTSLAPVPLDVSQGNVYLVLAGTGLRGGAGQALSATVGKQTVPVEGLAAYSVYAGVDVVALGPLPSSLAGAGLVNITVTVGSSASNLVTLLIQ